MEKDYRLEVRVRNNVCDERVAFEDEGPFFVSLEGGHDTALTVTNNAPRRLQVTRTKLR